MSPHAEVFTLGVEEEYQIIDPQTRQLCSRSPHLLSNLQLKLSSQIVQPEFRQSMNRLRQWLAPLLALSASSPFWLGNDTGYASYRMALISRLPVTGPPPILASYGEYQTVVQSLITTGSIQSATQVAWDLRLSERFPTLEFRIMDACMTLDQAVMIAGLARGLVRRCYTDAIPQMDMLPLMQEVRVCQNRKSGIAQQNSRIAHKEE